MRPPLTWRNLCRPLLQWLAMEVSVNSLSQLVGTLRHSMSPKLDSVKVLSPPSPSLFFSLSCQPRSPTILSPSPPPSTRSPLLSLLPSLLPSPPQCCHNPSAFPSQSAPLPVGPPHRLPGAAAWPTSPCHGRCSS